MTWSPSSSYDGLQNRKTKEIDPENGETTLRVYDLGGTCSR